MLPVEIYENIFYHIPPHKLHKVALNIPYLGYIIHYMRRNKYFEKWHSFGYDKSCILTPTKDNIKKSLRKHWYMNLKFTDDLYPLLLKHIIHVKKQNLIIDLAFTSINDRDIFVLKHLYGLNLTSCLNIFNVNVLGNLHSLDVSYTHIADVDALCRLHTLCLHGCPHILDVSALGNLHTLDLSHTNVSDVSALGNLHTLYLDLADINDVSMLGNLHTLHLTNCYNIKDVSALGNLHTLLLSCCYNIKDVSMLGDLHTLDLSYTNIRDVSALGNTHTLNLVGCINDISMLGYVSELFY